VFVVKTRSALLGTALILSALALGSGCATVQPNGRGTGVADIPGGYSVRPWTPPPAPAGRPQRNAALPGPVQPEAATPSALAVRWPIQGDDNGNATVEVAYRRSAEAAWRAALPLFWVHPKRAPAHLRVPGGRLFAGSIVNLDPDTAYEVRLSLSDPDGGAVVRTLALRTTREPVRPPDLRRRYAVPRTQARTGGGSGTAADPFAGLKAAAANAEPGDLILLRPGVYRAGGTRPARSGRPGRPIVFAGDGTGAVVLDGEGRASLVDVAGLEHIWFEGLTFRNADTLLQAEGARYIVARRNRFEVRNKNLAAGVEARRARGDESRGFFITDNVFIGPNTWPRRARRKTDAERIFGVAVTGAGHTIAYNRMRSLGDGVNNGRGGWLSASDINNNDIYDATDDCIEADHSSTNLRVFRNRLTNCFTGVSAQPIEGGPAYVFRNTILNAQYSPFKLHNDTSGLFLVHNTSVKAGIPFHIQPARESVNDVVSRNNIFIGTRGPALRSTGVMIRDDLKTTDTAGTGGISPFGTGCDMACPSSAGTRRDRIRASA